MNKRIYVLYAVGIDELEEEFATMEDAILFGAGLLRDSKRYTQATAFEVDVETYLMYVEGSLEGWLEEYATESISIRKDKPKDDIDLKGLLKGLDLE